MKIIKLNVIIACICFPLFACASFPKADNEHQTLVVGMIIQQGEGYSVYGSVSVNGTNRAGIEMTIQELNGAGTYVLRTNADGFFYSVNIPEGEYKVTKLYLKRQSGSSWASISWAIDASRERRFEITRGKVNNLGKIDWSCVSEVKNNVDFNLDYGLVRDTFQTKNKSSNWNEKEWVDIDIAGFDI